MASESYTIKDMQQLMMAEQKAQRDILDKQTQQLAGIEAHLRELNGKVARHQEVLFEKERGHGDRITKLEGWHLKIVGGTAAVSAIFTVLLQFIFKLFL